MQYNFQTNPFIVLGLHVSASQQDVVDAYEDRTSDDPANEALFAEARQALLTPRTRLIAEVGFLPDTPDGEVRRLIQLLSKRECDVDAVRASAQRLSPLSRSNIIAWLSTRKRPDADLMVDLNGAQAEIDHDRLFSAIERTRASAGIAPPTAEALRDAVLRQFEQQNIFVIQAIDDPTLIADAVGATTKRVLSFGDPDRTDLLDGFLQTYWRAVSRQTSDVRRDLEQCGVAILADPSDNGSIETYICSLKRWSRFGEPIKAFERAKGREDREAQSLQRMVRSLCLQLVNDKARSDVAYRITETALSVFAELERASGQLAEDLEHLKTNMAAEACSELEQQADAARKKPQNFAVALKRLAALSPGNEAAELLRELQEVLSRFPAPFDYPFLITRKLAVDLFNECKDTAATRIFTTEMLKAARTNRASNNVVELLEKDLRDLDRLDLDTELKRAIDADDMALAEAIIAKLLPLTQNSEERSVLTDIQARIRGKRTSRRVNIGFWLSVAIIILISAVANNGPPRQGSPPQRQPTSSPGPQRPATPPQPPQPGVLPILPSDFTESIPRRINPASVSGPQLSIAEIRYCKFEDVRLEKIRALISGARPRDAINLLNGRIADFNERCSRYTYRRGDLEIVERQAIERDAALTREAEAFLLKWQTTTPIVAPTTSFVEIKPNLEKSSTYTLENIRYCLYQEVRLNAAQRHTAEASLLVPFRTASDEWNRLCQRFSHRPQDLDSIRTEVIARSRVLQEEGASLVAEWRTSAPGPTRPPQPDPLITLDLLIPAEARRVQLRLAELGFFRGQADGTWGPASRSAMRAFNNVNGLGDTDSADTPKLTRLFATTAARALGSLPTLPPTYTETNFTAPNGANLHPLNKNDAIRIHRRLRELGFYKGKSDTLWSGASRVALREFKQRAGLPTDEVWDASTETALFSAPVDPKAETDKDFEQNISGRWSTEPQHCQRTSGHALPIVITKSRASVDNDGCEFLQRQGGGFNWTIRAACRVDAKTWIANIRLSRSGDSLTWSSERGVTVYRRCPT